MTWGSFLIQKWTSSRLVYPFVHVHLYIFVPALVCIYIETRMHTRTHMRAHTCAYRHTYIHVCTWVLRFDGPYVYIVIIVVTHTKYTILLWMMRMIAFITINGALVPLIRDICTYTHPSTHTHMHTWNDTLSLTYIHAYLSHAYAPINK